VEAAEDSKNGLAVEEIVPGVMRWTNIHPNTGMESSSHWVPAARAVVDPLLPDDQEIGQFGGNPPQDVLLTNRHHLRSSERFARELGCTINCHRAGLQEFEDGPEVAGFEWGEEVAPGIEALEVDAICDEETALLIADSRALSVADAVINRDGELGFFSDHLLGDDPEAVKTAIRDAYRRLLDRDFEHLLLAHGEPVVGRGKEALREFCG
jgi:glyoxylase-like metal-dependent hydrolase (beta-lactamase superfamily II)